MWDSFLKRLVTEVIVVGISIVVFYILLLQSIEISAKEGVRLLTIYILWVQDCSDSGQNSGCEFLEESLRDITGTKVIFDQLINLTLQVLFHLITLELLDEGTDIILSIITMLTPRPSGRRMMLQRYVGS